MDLFDELQNNIALLNASIKSLKTTSQAYATAEKEYKILLRQECLRLRDEGMAIGMITLTCYGIPAVAEARFNRDIAQANYQANQEAIQSFKLQIRLLDNQISREWRNPEGL